MEISANFSERQKIKAVIGEGVVGDKKQRHEYEQHGPQRVGRESKRLDRALAALKAGQAAAHSPASLSASESPSSSLLKEE